MNLQWYLNRLRKMSIPEILKRIKEYIYIYRYRIKYRNIEEWPYKRFAENTANILLHPLPGCYLEHDWTRFRIYNRFFDLTGELDWYFTENKRLRWPGDYYSTINYQQGNSYGDIRINWELNRLQFLPLMAAQKQDLACSILQSWLDNNPYLYGPAYVSSMEVALRWISVYRAICLFPKSIDDSLMADLTGLARATGTFIENRLSTNSKALSILSRTSEDIVLSSSSKK